MEIVSRIANYQMPSPSRQTRQRTCRRTLRSLMRRCSRPRRRLSISAGPRGAALTVAATSPTATRPPARATSPPARSASRPVWIITSRRVRSSASRLRAAARIGVWQAASATAGAMPCKPASMASPIWDRPISPARSPSPIIGSPPTAARWAVSSRRISTDKATARVLKAVTASRCCRDSVKRIAFLPFALFAYASAPVGEPTNATRIILVAPGVPSGTPATMMTRWPALAKPSRNAIWQARSTMSS